MEIMELVSGVLFLIALPSSLVVATTNRKSRWLVKLAYLCIEGAILLQIGLIGSRFSSAPVHKQFALIIALASMIGLAILMHHLTRTVLAAERKIRELSNDL